MERLIKKVKLAHMTRHRNDFISKINEIMQKHEIVLNIFTEDCKQYATFYCKNRDVYDSLLQMIKLSFNEDNDEFFGIRDLGRVTLVNSLTKIFKMLTSRNIKF